MTHDSTTLRSAELTSDPLTQDSKVQIRLSELQSIRDRLRKLCPGNNLIARLWEQVADLYVRLEKEAKLAKSQTEEADTR